MLFFYLCFGPRCFCFGSAFLFQEWKADLQQDWNTIVHDVIQYWRSNATHVEKGVAPSLAPSFDADGNRLQLPPGSPDLCDRILMFARRCPCLQLLITLTAKSDKTPNLDKLLYLLQHNTRQMSSYMRLCELLYIHAPSHTGKDVVGCLWGTFFGEMNEGGISCNSWVGCWAKGWWKPIGWLLVK